MCLTGSITLALLWLVPLVHGQAGKASGTISLGSTKIPPQAVTAVEYTAPQGRVISVLISDRPPDAKQFIERTKVGPAELLNTGLIEGAWKGLHFENQLSGFTFSFSAKRQIQSNEFLIGGKNKTFSVADEDLGLELASMSPRVVGRIRLKSAAPPRVGNQTVALDLVFEAPVTSLGK